MDGRFFLLLDRKEEEVEKKRWFFALHRHWGLDWIGWAWRGWEIRWGRIRSTYVVLCIIV
jgi:hypothetical protein